MAYQFPRIEDAPFFLKRSAAVEDLFELSEYQSLFQGATFDWANRGENLKAESQHFDIEDPDRTGGKEEWSLEMQYSMHVGHAALIVFTVFLADIDNPEIKWTTMKLCMYITSVSPFPPSRT